MELSGTALGDLVEDDSALAVLSREAIACDLHLGNRFEDRDVRVLALRERRRGAVGERGIEREVAVERQSGRAWI
jgi:hypothetical protein